MTEKEACVHEWIDDLSESREELGGFSVCPYASSSKTKIVECPIDDIVPESGYDVIVFIVEDFWRPEQCMNWAEFYNKKYPYYVFFEDVSSRNTFINGVKTNNKKCNLLLCQSKRKLNAIRKKLAETEYYSYWTKEYLDEVLGDQVEILENKDISG